MTNEHDIRDALVTIAETDPIDETGGWARITAGIEADAKRRRRHRVLLGGASVAVLGAAAALAVVAAQGDPRPEAVDTSPATQPTVSVPAEATTFPAGFGGSEPIATSGPVPAHPLLVLRQNDETGVTSLLVLDGDSGEILGMPAVEPNFSIGDPAIGPDGTIYFDRETGDSSHIEAIAWGTAEPYAPFDLGDETSSPAVSPDGTSFAYVSAGVTIDGASIVILDVGTGNEVRRLAWPDDAPYEASIHDLEWSVDGTRLLFIASFEGAIPMVVPADAASLAEATNVADLDVLSIGWFGDEVTAVAWCCYPEYTEPRRAHLGDIGSLQPVLGDETVDDFDGNAAGELAVVADGGLTIIGTDGQRRDVIGTASGVFSAELF